MHELAFTVTGSGPAVVLVPGTASTVRDTWGATVDALASSHTVIMPDLPGTGTSPLPDGPIDAATLAAQLVRVADNAGHDRFALAGASLGAPLALITAAVFPDHVTHVVSLCGFATARASLRLRLELWETILDADPDAVGRLLLILGMPDATAEQLPPEALQGMIMALGSRRPPGLRAQIELARTIDATGALDAIHVPALVIGAEGDQFVDPAHSRYLVDRLSHAHVLMLKGSHGLGHEQPTLIAQSISDLIAR
ncbi:alpha/beta hydrolase [Streptomyces sp. NPDC046977]|uniref:alpha/beta fold hydrolase n=1 Tax=Streptomyces sp. NPDC046977 TaxID=3154703 RepID=UPI0034081620